MTEEETKAQARKSVKLRNGLEVPLGLVTVVVMRLESLCASNPVLFYELVMKARDTSHPLWGSSGTLLREEGWLENDGNIQNTTGEIIRSVVQGEDLAMQIVLPAVAP